MNGSQGITPTVELATTNGNGYPMFGNGFGGFGDNGLWFIVILALLFGYGNGFGGWGGNGANNLATTDYISSEFIQRDINNLGTAVSNGFQNTNNAISNGFADNATNMCNIRGDIATGNMGLQNSIMDSKYANAMGNAETQKDILLQTTQLSNQANVNALQNQANMDRCCCDLRAEGIENTQKILDAMNQNTIDSLREQVNDLKNTITATATTNNVINSVRPFPVPSYLVSSPYSSIYNPYSYAYGFGNGFYGNAVI